MSTFARKTLLAALLAGVAAPALAADPYYAPVEEAAPPAVVYKDTSSYGGWYLRGDLDYHWTNMRGANYVVYDGTLSNDFDTADVEESWSLGGGVGYQINRHFRTDLTADWFFDADFLGSTSDGVNTSVDVSSYGALLLLANAYIDFGTWHGITPYVGAGIGGAWVRWNDLENTLDDGSFTRHEGSESWRFAYALTAGASYCLTQKLKFDAGYRFAHIQGGRMFEYANGAGPGYDEGFYTHEVRGGLRYQFGKSDCAEPEPYYEPPQPIYTK